MKDETKKGRGHDSPDVLVRCCGNCAEWGKVRQMRCGYEFEIDLPSGIHFDRPILKSSSGKKCKFYTPNVTHEPCGKRL